ncbi:MAG TPA: cation:proton antiporter, partial [Gemmatimonadales bacterium]
MRWGMLLALGLIMALLHRVTAGGPLEARATLALGFLLLAAHLGGDIAKGARLPRLTGYMLIGFAAGPRWLGLVRGDETVALRFFSDAGLALLALAAGSELRLEALRA